MNGSIMKIAGEDALRQNIAETKDYVDNNGAHTILNSSGTIMPRRKNLQIIGATLTDNTAGNKTILNITGGGGGMLPYLYIESEVGATVTVSQPDSTTINPTAAGSGHWECELTGGYGTYTIHSVLSGQGDATTSFAVDTVKEYYVKVYNVIVTTDATALEGETLTATNGTDTVTADIENGEAKFILSAGTWDVAGIPLTVVAGQEYTLPLVAFAFHYSENDSNPDSVTYPTGYDNSTYTDQFYVDLTTGVPHYGDWDKTDEKNRWLFPKMCMLQYDGTRDYYLYEDDVTKKEDGVTASDVANFSYGGNAMVEWGQDGRKIYWKIVPDADGKGFTFVVANGQADSDMHAWNHYNCRGELAEHFYTPMYFGSYNNNVMRSISGGTSAVSTDGNTELTRAKANNQTSDEIWNTEVYADWLLTAMLCTLISKSTNSQAKFGYGRCTGSSYMGQGTMNDKGLFYGKSNQTEGVKVFGMENPWGNMYRRIAGLINANGTVKIKLTYGEEDGSTVEGYNTTGSGYINHGTMSGTSGGYTSHMHITDRGITPETISGSSSTYYCDGAWFDNSQVDYAIVGGYWNGSLLIGCLCVSLNIPVSYSTASVGAALSCKPLAS